MCKVVRLVEELADYGHVPNDFVSGVGKVTMVGPNTVRLTFYARHQILGAEAENRPVHEQIWDADDLISMLEDWRTLAIDIKSAREQSQTPHNAPKRQRSGAH